MREWWNDYGFLILVIVIVVIFIGFLFGSLIYFGNQRVAQGLVQDYDHKILATEISALRADVHALQTQIAGKQ